MITPLYSKQGPRENRTGADLAATHRRVLLEDSAISPEIVAARGYRTARTSGDVPPEFAGAQRRPGLVIPTFSPSGEMGVQLRPDAPRARGLKYENPTGSRARLDVLPSGWGRLEDPTIPLWVTEGIKKADALTTAGALAVGLLSVWQFQRGGELLPCWEHVALEGRTVYVAFDSDLLTNPNVQAATVRMSEMLGARGANVLVVRIPGKADGGKVGIDDYIAAGGNLAALTEHARPVDPGQLRRDRLKADPPLRRGLRALWARWDAMGTSTMGTYTDRSVLRVLITRAGGAGRVTAGGVVVVLSQRDIAMGAATSKRSAEKAIRRLEGRGYLKRAKTKPGEGKAASYLLLTSEGGRKRGRAEGSHNGGKGRKEVVESSVPSPSTPHSGYPLRAPGGEGVPELRWSGLLPHTERDRMGRETTVYEPLKRLGKKRGAILEYLLDVGGEAEVYELMGRFAGAKARPRDFYRRVLEDLVDAGVIEVGGGAVLLCEGWRDRLEQARLLVDEHGAARRQRDRFEREREAYRRRHETEADPVPDPPALDDIRQRWERHPESCACRECTGRFGRVVGEHIPDCRCAGCYAARRGRASSKATVEVWVEEPRVEEPQTPSAQIATPPVAAKSDTPGNSEAEDQALEAHGLACECDGCMYPEPRYVNLGVPLARIAHEAEGVAA